MRQLDTTYGYNAAGNLITELKNGTTRTFTYNYSQRLASVTENSVTLGQYTYDALGRRTKKVANGNTTLYIYDQNGLLIAEYSGDGIWQKDYVYLNGQPLAMIIAGTPETVYYYHNDHLGTPQMMTDSNGAVVWAATYEPFGKATMSNELITNNLRFPGQYYDAETGLHYNWFRYYDPETGRYIESDPIGGAGGINLFAYVENNAVNLIDPFGLAYFAKRPLKGLPWLGSASSNPIDDYLNTEASHVQLFFEDSKSPSNIGFFDDGTLKSEPNPTGYRHKSKHYNDCIMRKAVKNVKLQTYSLLGKPGKVDKFNCQDWAEEVRKEYRKLENDCSVKEECGGK